MNGSARSLASLNLARTYLALGRASPDSRIVEQSEFMACTGPVAHPVCNFAIAQDINAGAARALADLACDRPTFNVYVASEQADDPGSRLCAEGFRQAYRLRLMVGEGTREETPCVLQRCGSAERLETADFMVREFFGRSESASRDAIRSATAAAPELELYEVRDCGTRVAAAMLSRSEGLVGLYNLCVRFDMRGKGWGSTIVRSILALAGAEGLSVSLQCDPSLEVWYERLGFHAVGSVDVYVLDRSPQPDIMKSQ